MRAIFRKEFPNDFLMRIRMRHFPKIVSAWDIRMSQVSEWETRMGYPHEQGIRMGCPNGFLQSSRAGFLKPHKLSQLSQLSVVASTFDYYHYQ